MRGTRKKERKVRKQKQRILRNRIYVNKRGKKRNTDRNHSEKDDKREGKRGTNSEAKL